MSIVQPSIACIYIDENHDKNIIGGMVLHNPASLQELIISIQQKTQHYDEIKFSKISATKLTLYQLILEKIKRYNYEKFYCKQYANSLDYASYIDFVLAVIDDYTDIDYFIVFVDYLSFPKWVLFEKLMIESSPSIIFCLREDSKSNKLLQASDLLLWCMSQYFGISTISSPYKNDLLATFEKLQLQDDIIILPQKKGTPP